MAQLIKLQDYISRYEWDTYRYPTQYIRMKRESWNRLYDEWSNRNASIQLEMSEEDEESMFEKLKQKLLKKNVSSEVIQEDTIDDEKEWPATEEELKQQFLDNLLNFQMKWATSTVTHQSIVDEKYYEDPLLKYLLQRFPDTFLVMYYPIFSIRHAPIESEIIIITPIEIEIVKFIEIEEEAVIMAGEERVWHVESPGNHRKILNPLISLRRTEKLLKSIFASQNVTFPIKKTVISRKNPIVFASEPYQTRIVGLADYKDWFKAKRTLHAPLKSAQIKAAETLLKFCQSTSMRRPEWMEGEEKNEHTEMGET